MKITFLARLATALLIAGISSAIARPPLVNCPRAVLDVVKKPAAQDFSYVPKIAPINVAGAIIEPQSFAKKLPGLLEELAAIEADLPDMNVFISAFHASKGGYPAAGDIIAFTFGRRTAMAGRLQKLADKYKAHPNLNAYFVSLETRIRPSDDVIHHAFRNISQVLSKRGNAAFTNRVEIERMARFCGVYKSSFAELEAFARLDGAHSFAVRFHEKPQFTYSSLITQKITAALKRELDDLDPVKLRMLQYRYPLFFSNMRIRILIHSDPGLAHKSTAAEIQQAITKWVKSHEIDVIRNLPGGKTAWVEVKYYEHVITRESLLSGKDMEALKQARKKKELRRFLGLENEVELEFFPVRGITGDAAAELAKHGVKINPAAIIKPSKPQGHLQLLPRPYRIAAPLFIPPGLRAA